MFSNKSVISIKGGDKNEVSVKYGVANNEVAAKIAA